MFSAGWSPSSRSACALAPARPVGPGSSEGHPAQTLRFAKHPVLLDGGIQMLVEGLLTFKITDGVRFAAPDAVFTAAGRAVEKLIHQLGDEDLERSIQDVTKVGRAGTARRAHRCRLTGARPSVGRACTRVCHASPGADLARR
jgi:hypothetical protein